MSKKSACDLNSETASFATSKTGPTSDSCSISDYHPDVCENAEDSYMDSADESQTINKETEVKTMIYWNLVKILNCNSNFLLKVV